VAKNFENQGLKMPNVAVKRIYTAGWEKQSVENQAILRERMRALCTKDVEEKGIRDVSRF